MKLTDLRDAAQATIDRIDPGTMRSVVIVLCGAKMGLSAETITDAAVGLALFALGAISALMSSKKAKAEGNKDVP